MAGVIRREHLPRTPHFSFPDVEHEAGEILARAAAEGERLIADARRLTGDLQQRARQQAEIRHREAYEQGRQEGHAAAKQEARDAAVRLAAEELQQLTRALATALAEFERNKHGLLAVGEAGLITLAVAIARRVCRTLAEGSPEPARANVLALLELVRHHDDLEVSLHPADYALLGTIPGELLPSTAALQHVKLVADAGVERGGCVLKTRDGTIDAGLSTQLDRIAAVICASQHSACDSGSAVTTRRTDRGSST